MESFLSTVTGGRYYSGGAGQEGLGYPELYSGAGQPWPRYPGPVSRTEESSAPPPGQSSPGQYCPAPCLAPATSPARGSVDTTPGYYAEYNQVLPSYRCIRNFAPETVRVAMTF